MTPSKHQGYKLKEAEPTQASLNNEAVIITVPSPTPSSAEPRTTRQRSRREFNDNSEDIDSTQPDNLKRRRLN